MSLKIIISILFVSLFLLLVICFVTRSFFFVFLYLSFSFFLVIVVSFIIFFSAVCYLSFSSSFSLHFDFSSFNFFFPLHFRYFTFVIFPSFRFHQPSFHCLWSVPRPCLLAAQTDCPKPGSRASDSRLGRHTRRPVACLLAGGLPDRNILPPSPVGGDGPEGFVLPYVVRLEDCLWEGSTESLRQEGADCRTEDAEAAQDVIWEFSVSGALKRRGLHECLELTC